MIQSSQCGVMFVECFVRCKQLSIKLVGEETTPLICLWRVDNKLPSFSSKSGKYGVCGLHVRSCGRIVSWDTRRVWQRSQFTSEPLGRFAKDVIWTILRPPGSPQILVFHSWTNKLLLLQVHVCHVRKDDRETILTESSAPFSYSTESTNMLTLNSNPFY